MLYFIGGALAGAFLGALAMALVAGNEANLKDRRIRELTAIKSTLEAGYEGAKARAEHWQKQYWKLRTEQTKSPEAEA